MAGPVRPEGQTPGRPICGGREVSSLERRSSRPRAAVTIEAAKRRGDVWLDPSAVERIGTIADGGGPEPGEPEQIAAGTPEPRRGAARLLTRHVLRRFARNG